MNRRGEEGRDGMQPNEISLKMCSFFCPADATLTNQGLLMDSPHGESIRRANEQAAANAGLVASGGHPPFDPSAPL